jgi:hypothetical protein
MIDWKAKLTSRKFWAAIAQFVTMLILAFKGSEETATQVTALIMAGAAVVAYIIGEGLIDAAAAKGDPVLLEEDAGPGGYDPEVDDGK